ncbi:SGNH/GDSL hydrolase family protein [Streptomyces sp. NPDC059002]|uniref:SGNH/GDSL hydrolase family protein n=1 Tax=Streptomyces sp. NPDC059002 TaxID=3346690 RepID=UPI0036A80998
MHLRAPARRLTGALAAVGTTAVLGLTASATEAATAAATEPLPYVALGDSYSAASGNFPLDPAAPLLCARSTTNYPHVIAKRIGAHLQDVTCGGAQTKDFTTPQYPGVAPQLDAVKPGTKLVTMTIGGNDNNTFISSVLACGAAGVLSGGQGSPCKDIFKDSLAQAVEAKTGPAVTAALRAVRHKAPAARVAILGYPSILPAKADPSCFARMPIASGDVPFLHDLETRLNRVIERAAAESGATFVDMAAASKGHDACKPVGTRWIEPVVPHASLASVHPNALGEAKMAEHTIQALNLD